jgi:uncharacterized protein (DUF2336 family)
MSAIQEVIGQLEGSLQGSSGSQRLELLRSVTDLYLGGAPTHSEQNIELFDQVLNQLIDYMEAQALAVLSSQLAPIETAPAGVVRRLARHDDIVVSAPLLRQSTCLDVGDLIEIANTKSQEHLAVIGSRAVVDEAVTDALVARGDSNVARIIAANSGAHFSDGGFSCLVTRAETEVGLAELVAIRAEMSPRHFRQLVTRATETVRRRLMSISDPRTHAKITKVTAQIAREIDRSGSVPDRDFSAAQNLVNSIRDEPTLLRSRLLEFATRKRFEETVVSLAALGDLSLPVVEKLMSNKEDDGGILLLCRGIGIEWPTARAILSLAADGIWTTTLNDARVRFDKLNASTARRIIRFWRVRTSVVTPGSD